MENVSLFHCQRVGLVCSSRVQRRKCCSTDRTARLICVLFSPSSLVWWRRSGLVFERYLFWIQVGTGFSWFLLVLPGKYRDYTRLCQDRVLSNLYFVTHSSSHHRRSKIVRNHSVVKNNEANCLCPPHIPHEFAWDWTRASEIRGRQLTAWGKARFDNLIMTRNLSRGLSVHIHVLVSCVCHMKIIDFSWCLFIDISNKYVLRLTELIPGRYQ